MKRKLVLVLMLVLMLLMLVPFEALAQEIVDGAVWSTQDSPAKRYSFYAEGRYWEFYKNTSTEVQFRSSLDGITWSAATSYSPPTGTTFGTYVDIAYDETQYIHVVENNYDAGSNAYCYYNRGDPNPDGTITWTGFDLVSAAWYVHNTSICIDGNGYPYIGYTCLIGAGHAHYYVIKSSTSNGHWTTDWNTELASGSTYFNGRVIGLTGGKIVAFYQTAGGAGVISAQRWTGAGWGAATTSPISILVGGSYPSNFGYYSAVGQDDYVHIAALETTSNDIEYTKYSYSTNSFSAATTVYSGATATSIPSMSMDNANNLHVFWENDPTDDHMYYAKYIYDESTWVSYYDLIDEIDDLPATGYYLNTDYTCDESRVGVYYIADSTILKFKLLDEALHVDTLDASPIAETTATLRGEIISLGFGSATERGFWINDTPSLSGATQEGNETGTFNVGVFTHGITGLTEGYKYYYCAYASNDYGLEYGTWSQFTAGGSAGGIAVLTLDPTDVGDFEATFNGNIVATGGGYLTMRGFQYGHSDTPTWLWDEGGNFTVGLFSHTPTDLEADSIYYVRAIAGNGTDTDYGQWIGFITEQPSYVPGEGDTYADLITAPIPTTAPGGWIRPGKDYNGFPIISPLINTFADLGFGRSFFWFVVEVFCIIVLTLIGARFTKNLPITFGILLVLFLLPFIAFEYLDWWMLAPFLVVGGALCIKEGQFSWS